MTDRADLSYQALAKARALLRDVLYLRYEEQWREHDRFAGKFFGDPTDQDKAFMAFLFAYADGDSGAISAVMEFA